METRFKAATMGDQIKLTIMDESGDFLTWHVRARPFLFRIRLFSAKRRLYRAWRKWKKIRNEFDEA